MNKKNVTIQTDHPLESFLGIEDNSTLMTHTERQQQDLVVSDLYDDKDCDIEEQISEIQREALDAHDALREKMDSGTDPKYLARLGEVDNQYLGTALSAIAMKAKIKAEKDKLANKKNNPSGPNKIVNNTVIMDRNEMLKNMMNGNTIIDGDQL
jgi:hypothetical protein